VATILLSIGHGGKEEEGSSMLVPRSRWLKISQETKVGSSLAQCMSISSMNGIARCHQKGVLFKEFSSRELLPTVMIASRLHFSIERWPSDACGGDIFSSTSWEPQEEGMMNIAVRFSLS
jgi:hypothetical protein